MILAVETVEETLNVMAEAREQLMELLQGDTGTQFAAMNTGWDVDADGTAG